MSSQVTANVICVFEIAGSQADAQKFIMERVRNTGGATNVAFSGFRLIRWCDPDLNVAKTYPRSGETYYRYTVSFEVHFTIAGSYAEAQKWLLDRLYEGEEKSLMNVESIQLNLIEIPEVVGEA